MLEAPGHEVEIFNFISDCSTIQNLVDNTLVVILAPMVVQNDESLLIQLDSPNRIPHDIVSYMMEDNLDVFNTNQIPLGSMRMVYLRSSRRISLMKSFSHPQF